MKKIEVKLELHGDRDKRKAMKAVASLQGVDSIEIKEQKLTVIGNVDPVHVMQKVGKCWHAELQVVGPAKEEKKDEGKKKVDANKAEPPPIVTCYQYMPHPMPLYMPCIEEYPTPNICVIC